MVHLSSGLGTASRPFESSHLSLVSFRDMLLEETTDNPVATSPTPQDLAIRTVQKEMLNAVANVQNGCSLYAVTPPSPALAASRDPEEDEQPCLFVGDFPKNATTVCFSFQCAQQLTVLGTQPSWFLLSSGAIV